MRTSAGDRLLSLNELDLQSFRP